jgi:hypothetical protein
MAKMLVRLKSLLLAATNHQEIVGDLDERRIRTVSAPNPSSRSMMKTSPGARLLLLGGNPLMRSGHAVPVALTTTSARTVFLAAYTAVTTAGVLLSTVPSPSLTGTLRGTRSSIFQPGNMGMSARACSGASTRTTTLVWSMPLRRRMSLLRRPTALSAARSPLSTALARAAR